LRREGTVDDIQGIETLIKHNSKRVDNSNDRSDVQGKEFGSLVFSRVYEIFVPIRVRVEYDMREGRKKGRFVVRDDAVSPLCRLFPSLPDMIRELEPYLALEKTEKKLWERKK